MQISLSDAGKRFNRDWIFRNLTYQFQSGISYAITGPNGSGKSTLLQIIAGAVGASEGSIDYTLDSRKVDIDNVFDYLSVAAPYLELIEEMTLVEFLSFHSKFKPFMPGHNARSIIGELRLEKAAGKQIRYYSSGMKQRVKLAQAFFSATPCLLLDEPCTNLDEDGIALYKRLVKNYTGKRLVIVSSNDRLEYDFCTQVLNVMNFK